VNLVKIHDIDGEATQALFEFAPDRISAQRYSYIAMRVPAPAALGEDIGSRTGSALESTADHFLRVSQTVDGGRVDPVDADFECTVNGGD
jgi:hypothetical protein